MDLRKDWHSLNGREQVSLCCVPAQPADTEAWRCQLPPVPLNKVLTPGLIATT